MRRDVFQAIADPTRRAIVALIALQAMSPSAIADHLNMSRQAISKHMKILTECELVREGCAMGLQQLDELLPTFKIGIRNILM